MSQLYQHNVVVILIIKGKKEVYNNASIVVAQQLKFVVLALLYLMCWAFLVSGSWGSFVALLWLSGETGLP